MTGWRGVTSPEARPALAAVRVLALDVDGVLTDGGLYYGPDGEVLKRFSARDGLGIRLAQFVGIEVGVVTARTGSIVGRRMSELGVERVTLGCESKAAGLRDLAVACGVELQEVLYVGDDVLDVPAMELAGVATAPADAHELARNVANWVTERPGGYGAVREVCDALVAARGSLEEICRRYLARV